MGALSQRPNDHISATHLIPASYLATVLPMNVDIVGLAAVNIRSQLHVSNIDFITNIQTTLNSHFVKPEAGGVLVTGTLLQVPPVPCAA